MKFIFFLVLFAFSLGTFLPESVEAAGAQPAIIRSSGAKSHALSIRTVRHHKKHRKHKKRHRKHHPKKKKAELTVSGTAAV